MKMTQEENFPNVAKQPRPLDRREKPPVHSDKKVTAHARCGQRDDGRLCPIVVGGKFTALDAINLAATGPEKSKSRAMRHREVTHRGGCPGNRASSCCRPPKFSNCVLNLLLRGGIPGQKYFVSID